MSTLPCFYLGPFWLLVEFTLSTCFCCPFSVIRILGIPFGSNSFFSSSLREVLDENVHHVDLRKKLRDVQVPFKISFWCFVQRLSYMFHCFYFLLGFETSLPFSI
jgi:hypothetical protein